MKIGVLTFHNTTNFGATLQCSALVKIISEEGHDVEVINYVPIGPTINYLQWMFLGKTRSIKNIGKIAKFKIFQMRNYRLSGWPIFTIAKLEKRCGNRYDCVVIGSDEVWKVDELRTFDRAYYGSFVTGRVTKVCTYAASSSSGTILENYSELVRPLFKKMSAISVRDLKTKSEVSNIFDSSAVLVLDPTLVAERPEREQKAKCQYRKYIAIYANLDPSESQILKNYADLNDLKLVGVGVENSKFDKCYVSIGPKEWMNLLDKSSLVVTNYYHGILFALMFNRPLFAYIDNIKRHKIQSVMEMAGLEHLLFESFRSISGLNLEELSYSDSKLANFEKLRLISRDFLKEELIN